VAEVSLSDTANHTDHTLYPLLVVVSSIIEGVCHKYTQPSIRLISAHKVGVKEVSRSLARLPKDPLDTYPDLPTQIKE
jgi:hypothetical protein